MFKNEEATDVSKKMEGIPLKRAEGLLLVMDTPKGADSVTLPILFSSSQT
jgi:hypothetical protein